MTELDHTTVASFLADFKHLPGRTFRFKGRRTGSMSRPWKLVTARPWQRRTAVRLCVKYEDDSRVFFDFHTDGTLYRCDHFKVAATTYDMSVVVVPRLSTAQRSGGDSSVDDSQRRRLNDNLRGMFA